MSSSAFQLPDDFINLMQKLNDGSTIEENIKISGAISLFTKKVVTLERAAEISGISLIDFMDILADHGIPWGEYTEEMSQQDDIAVKKILKGSK